MVVVAVVREIPIETVTLADQAVVVQATAVAEEELLVKVMVVVMVLLLALVKFNLLVEVAVDMEVVVKAVQLKMLVMADLAVHLIQLPMVLQNIILAEAAEVEQYLVQQVLMVKVKEQIVEAEVKVDLEERLHLQLKQAILDIV
jgi:hypothetical protein